MIWTRPWLLLLLVPWLLFMAWQWRRARSAGRWSQVMDPQLLSALGYRAGQQRQPGLSLALGLAGVLLIVALAGPARSLAGGTALSQGSLVVVLDNSLSMAVEDLSPSRLVRARRTALDWAGSSLFQRTAVIAYSGTAHWLTPFTRDVETLQLQLNQLDPYLMPQYGNRPDRAFARVREKLAEWPEQRVHLLWLTDDASPERLGDIQTNLTQNGQVWIMPFGTEAGGPIPLPNNQGFLNDGSQMVVPRLERAEFSQAAEQLGARVLAPGQQPQAAWLGTAGREASEERAVREFGYWLLIPALMLLLPWYRRGLVYALPAMVLLQPPAAEAAQWTDWLLKNREQRAWQALNEGEHEQAEALSRRPAIDASAAFRQGDYDEAIDHWAELDTPAAHFNRGNALVRQGELEPALEAYQRAIDLGHEAARENHRKVKDFLERQQQGSGNQQNSEQQPSDSDSEGQSGQDNPQSGDESNQPSQSESESNQPESSPSDSDPRSSNESQSQQADDAQQAEEPGDGEPQPGQQQADSAERLRQQAVEQLLNQVPSAPESILRHKFQYQYEKDPERQGSNEQETPTW
ncbi:VWA domain-containing protein [Saccharospirillum salsuginis]|uniref:VWFA domain-containing protein n=1 Tax=Saccharospirillum salsuginis TaxID=418750 RepID=A0A918KRU9_9GAMM|nr:VWA domain-containing protein [Saccharospirillum salsuginis]GGX73592.1 hypothetical protein GCM10007392_46320 [Saccharospirillum salsuginis]